jgi:3-oxoadipate enol-lactonase
MKRKTMLCIHGNRDSSRVFDSIKVSMEEVVDVVTMDLRGHGQSPVPANPFSIDDMVDDIREELDHRNLCSVFLLGHSLGATLSLLFTARFPDRVDKLILIGAAAGFTPSFKRPNIHETITPEMVEETNRNAAPYFFTSRRPEVQENILAGWKRMPPRMHEFMIRIEHPDLYPILEQIRKPVLVICGDADKITPLEKSIELDRLLPDSRLLVIPHAGHFVFMEEEQKIVPQVIAFILGE